MYSIFLSNILLSNSELSPSDNFKCSSAKCHRRYHICHVLECVGGCFQYIQKQYVIFGVSTLLVIILVMLLII